MGKTTKGKRKFERIRKRYKLCKEEMDVTEELKLWDCRCKQRFCT